MTTRSKVRSPLQKVQRSIDDVKKRLDALVAEERDGGQRSSGPGNRELGRRCEDLRAHAESVRRELSALGKADEPAPVSDYDGKKQEEERRLQRILAELRQLAQRCAPPDSREGTESEEEDDEEAEEGEDDDEDEDDEDDDEDGDDEDGEEVKQVKGALVQQAEEAEGGGRQTREVQLKTFVALSDFTSQEAGDLSFRKGAVLLVLSKKPDGWWEAQDEHGARGMVPSTYLQHQMPDKVQEDDQDDDEDDDDEDDEESVPSSEEEAGSRRHDTSSGRALKAALDDTSASAAMTATGAVPSGFRPSTLHRLLLLRGESADEFSTRGHLLPRLGPSQLSFRDLQWSEELGGVRPRTCRVSRTFYLAGAKAIPPPGPGVQVASLHVRVCLFDGRRVLSNVHAVRATWRPRNPGRWTFSPRVGGLLPSLLDGEFFARSDNASPNLGLLFELGISYVLRSRAAATDTSPATELELGELSCGWAFMRLFAETGLAIASKSYELDVHGGTPYERDVELDPSAAGRAGGALRQIFSNARPRLLVRARTPAAPLRQALDRLPQTLVSCVCYVSVLVMYRQLLASALLEGRGDETDARPVADDVLASLGELVGLPDVMDALRSVWAERRAGLRRAERADRRLMEETFRRAHRDTAQLLLHLANLPPNRWGHGPNEAERWMAIGSILSQGRQAGGSLLGLLSPELQHEPFHIDQVAFSLTRDAPVHARESGGGSGGGEVAEAV
ncbi:nephrocystin-1 [Lampetra fluviatilis]